MSDSFVPRVGGILSADIAVPEHEREVRFYSRVLGTGETPLWREDLMNNRGMPIIGLGARSAELEDLPLQWMPHIQVADVAASVERALDLSGRELMHGKDEDGNSWVSGRQMAERLEAPPLLGSLLPAQEPSRDCSKSLGAQEVPGKEEDRSRHYEVNPRRATVLSVSS